MLLIPAVKSDFVSWMLIFPNKITHLFSFQQFHTHFIPVTAVGHHWMDTGVIPAGKDCHGDTGICCPLQLPADLGYLLVCSCPKKNFGNAIFIFFLLCVAGIFISFFSWRTGTLSARARRLQTKTKKIIHNILQWDECAKSASGLGSALWDSWFRHQGCPSSCKKF